MSMKTLRANAFLAIVALVLVREAILETFKAIRAILRERRRPAKVRPL